MFAYHFEHANVAVLTQQFDIAACLELVEQSLCLLAYEHVAGFHCFTPLMRVVPCR